MITLFHNICFKKLRHFDYFKNKFIQVTIQKSRFSVQIYKQLLRISSERQMFPKHYIYIYTMYRHNIQNINGGTNTAKPLQRVLR